jgi:N6-L-threonylcarbamoyladenine synthase
MRGEKLILAIETSCDETAAAVVADGGPGAAPPRVLSSVVATQIEWHARFGGVVPEIASRKHVEHVGPVVDEALDKAGASLDDLAGIAVTHGPGLVGALLVGLAYAKGLAFVTGLPLVGVNHLEGHLFAVMLEHPEVEPPFVALVVSGGHTSLVYCAALGEYETLGETLDDAVGEAFDKIAKFLGLGYPGGPEIAALAKKGDPHAIEFPRAMLHSGDYDFSLSGLKTAVINHVRREQAAGREVDTADLAASFQAAAVDVPVAKVVRAAEEKGVDRVLLAGGVAANVELRDRMRAALAPKGIAVAWPAPALCTDNAVMIGAAAHFRLWRGETIGFDSNALPNLRL